MPLSTPQPPAYEIHALFDRIAPTYDQLNHQLSFGLHHVWKKMTVRWSQPPQGGCVLDLCCGTGDLALHLARRVSPQGQVYGLDFSEPLLQIAQQRSQQLLPRHTFKWFVGDALDLPFADQTFDAITMGYGLRNLSDRLTALTEMYRVLKPGSRASILDFGKPQDEWAQSFQAWYLQSVVVPTATAYGLAADYAYISLSLEQFLTGSEQLELATSVGFKDSTYYPLFWGLMGVLVIQKST